eukprot:1138431-Pelagomonas_calceolata.AAC.1
MAGYRQQYPRHAGRPGATYIAPGCLHWLPPSSAVASPASSARAKRTHCPVFARPRARPKSSPS